MRRLQAVLTAVGLVFAAAAGNAGPMHAAGEISNVIKAIKTGEMPEDDIGLRKDIPADDRAAVLKAAIAFRNKFVMADK